MQQDFTRYENTSNRFLPCSLDLESTKGQTGDRSKGAAASASQTPSGLSTLAAPPESPASTTRNLPPYFPPHRLSLSLSLSLSNSQKNLSIILSTSSTDLETRQSSRVRSTQLTTFDTNCASDLTGKTLDPQLFHHLRVRDGQRVNPYGQRG
jgi:hypothetical protein